MALKPIAVRPDAYSPLETLIPSRPASKPLPDQRATRLQLADLRMEESLAMVISPTLARGRAISSSRPSRSRSFSRQRHPIQPVRQPMRQHVQLARQRLEALTAHQPLHGGQLFSSPRCACRHRLRHRRRRRVRRALSWPKTPARPDSSRSCRPCSTPGPREWSARRHLTNSRPNLLAATLALSVTLCRAFCDLPGLLTNDGTPSHRVSSA